MNILAPEANKVAQQLLEGLQDGGIVIDASNRCDPDIQASEDFSKLNPAARQQYMSSKLVEHLRSETQGLRNSLVDKEVEMTRLRTIEIDHAQLTVLHKSGRWITGIGAFLMAIGGALVSTFGEEDIGFGIGWGLIIVVGIVQLGKSIFDW